MTTVTPSLKSLEFLLGRWRSRAENQFGQSGVIEGNFETTYDPGNTILATVGESRSIDGKLINKAMTYLAFDNNIEKFVRKSIYSYGWILNEVGSLQGDRLELDVLSIDCQPDFFRGLRWRSFVQKYSDNEIGLGLDVAKNGEPFRPYGETRAKRVIRK